MQLHGDRQIRAVGEDMKKVLEKQERVLEVSVCRTSRPTSVPFTCKPDLKRPLGSILLPGERTEGSHKLWRGMML